MRKSHVFKGIFVSLVSIIPTLSTAQNIPNLGALLDVTHAATTGNYGFFGSTAAIQFGDGSRWSNAAGLTGPDNASQGGRALNVADRFHIGSQTKTYTGTVVMQLIDQGLISFEDTLETWYKRQPYVMQALQVMQPDLRKIVTVHDLLSMRTGIPEPLSGADPYTPKETVLNVWNAKTGKYDLTVEQLLVASLGQNPTMTPGDEGTFEYSNMNFMLLGLIAEAASCELGSCKTIRELITDLVTSEGLDNTIYPIGTEWGTDAHTNGTWDYFGVNSDFTETTPSVPNAAGAMISNIDDQLDWLVEVTTNRHGTLSPETFAKRFERTSDMNGMVGLERAGYGLAMYGQHSLDTGALMLGHGGELSGYQTLMFRYPGDASTDLDDLFVVANVNTFLNVQNKRIFPASDIHSMYYDLQRSAAMYDMFEATPDGCTSDGGGIVCTGTTLADTTIPVFETTLTIQPSGQRWVAPQVNFDVSVPTWVFYGNDETGVAATNATINIENQGKLEGYGNGMTLLQTDGSSNSINISGEMRAIGDTAIAIDASAQSNDMIVINSDGVLNGDVSAIGGADRVSVAGALNGDVKTGADASIDGAGTITGMVSGSGRLRPGILGEDNPNAMTLGRYEATGGILEITIFGPQGGASSLLVDQQISESFNIPETGIAVLTNGTLRLGGTPPTDDQFILLLHADQGLTGTFAKIEDPAGMLSADNLTIQSEIVYTDNSVFLRSRTK